MVWREIAAEEPIWFHTLEDLDRKINSYQLALLSSEIHHMTKLCEYQGKMKSITLFLVLKRTGTSIDISR